MRDAGGVSSGAAGDFGRLAFKPEAKSATAYPQLRADGTVDLTGRQVLLVKDERSSREGVRTLLETNAAQVQTAESASGAEGTYRLRPPDILISDIGLPGEDGYALIQHIRSLEQQQAGPRKPATGFDGFRTRRGPAARARGGLRCVLGETGRSG